MKQDSIKRKFSKTGKLTLIDTIDDTQVTHSRVVSLTRFPLALNRVVSLTRFPLALNPPLRAPQTQELYSIVEAQSKAANKRSALATCHLGQNGTHWVCIARCTCLMTLGPRHNAPEPLRVSPLGKLFAEAIGGNCKTLMLMQTSHDDAKVRREGVASSVAIQAVSAWRCGFGVIIKQADV